VQLIWDWLHM